MICVSHLDLNLNFTEKWTKIRQFYVGKKFLNPRTNRNDLGIMFKLQQLLHLGTHADSPSVLTTWKFFHHLLPRPSSGSVTHLLSSSRTSVPKIQNPQCRLCVESISLWWCIDYIKIYALTWNAFSKCFKQLVHVIASLLQSTAILNINFILKLC